MKSLIATRTPSPLDLALVGVKQSVDFVTIKASSEPLHFWGEIGFDQGDSIIR